MSGLPALTPVELAALAAGACAAAVLLFGLALLKRIALCRPNEKRRPFMQLLDDAAEAGQSSSRA